MTEGLYRFPLKRGEIRKSWRFYEEHTHKKISASSRNRTFYPVKIRRAKGFKAAHFSPLHWLGHGFTTLSVHMKMWRLLSRRITPLCVCFFLITSLWITTIIPVLCWHGSPSASNAIQQQQGSPLSHTDTVRARKSRGKVQRFTFIIVILFLAPFALETHAGSVTTAPPTFFQTGQAHWIQVQRLYWSPSGGSGGLRGPHGGRRGAWRCFPLRTRGSSLWGIHFKFG